MNIWDCEGVHIGPTPLWMLWFTSSWNASSAHLSRFVVDHLWMLLAVSFITHGTRSCVRQCPSPTQVLALSLLFASVCALHSPLAIPHIHAAVYFATALCFVVTCRQHGAAQVPLRTAFAFVLSLATAAVASGARVAWLGGRTSSVLYQWASFAAYVFGIVATRDAARGVLRGW